ncbi:MAG TPA: hypothetical protein VF774_22000 [Pseudoduganella sp.]|jgi:hypothetical protein
MGCCIVVALIISQIFACRDRIRRLLGMKVDDAAGHDPLLAADLRLRLRRVAVPALALSMVGGLAYQHRGHLAALAAPSAHAASPAVAAAVCRGTTASQEPHTKSKETP